MAQLKHTPPYDVVVAPNVARARRRLADAPFRSRGEDDAALAKIAQRFAPNADAGAPVPPDRHVTRNPSAPLPQVGDAALGPSRGGALAAFKILPAEIRRLVVALMLIAVLPSLTFAAMFFFAGARAPWLAGQSSAEGEGQGPRAQVAVASLADLPAQPRATEPAAPHRTASLAAPSSLEAKAGQSVPFALALASVAPLPEPSVIAVSGLPRGATFSAGQPYGESEWNLRPDEIGGLRLLLPRDARGEAKLDIVLIAADGTRLASAETSVNVSADVGEAVTGAPAPVVADASASVGAAPQASAMQAAATEVSSTQAPATQKSTPAPAKQTSSKQQASSAQDSSTQEPAAQESAAQGSATSSTHVPAPMPDVAATDARSAITLSEFVNLREGPTSSARVIGMIAKGAAVTPLERRRGWLKVTDAGSGETGWIYGRYAGGTRQSSSSDEASPLRLGPSSDDSFWTRVGNWLSGP